VDLADAGDLRGLFGDGADVRARDQQMDFAELGGGGDGGERRILELPAFMFNENEALHPSDSRLAILSRRSRPALVDHAIRP
jgi:hypothetical protein